MALDPDPYRILELPPGATLDEVKRAYRRLAKVHHPDAAGEAALPRFLAIQAAYEQLLPARRPGRVAAGPPARRDEPGRPTRTGATRRVGPMAGARGVRRPAARRPVAALGPDRADARGGGGTERAGGPAEHGPAGPPTVPAARGPAADGAGPDRAAPHREPARPERAAREGRRPDARVDAVPGDGSGPDGERPRTRTPAGRAGRSETRPRSDRPPMTAPTGRSSQTGAAPAGTGRRAARTGRSTRRNTRTRASTDRSTRHGPGERCGPGRPRSARPTRSGRTGRIGRSTGAAPAEDAEPKRPVEPRTGRPAGQRTDRGPGGRADPHDKLVVGLDDGTGRRCERHWANGRGPICRRGRAMGRRPRRASAVAAATRPRSGCRGHHPRAHRRAARWRPRTGGARGHRLAADRLRHRLDRAASSPAAVDSRRPATGPQIRWC